MNINWIVIPTLCIALALFMVGRISMRRCRSGKSRVSLAVVWFLLGIPGFLMASYYLHWFDDAKWFYVFRSLPLTELTAAGAGLFVGAWSEWMKDSSLFPKPVFVALLCLGLSVPYLKPILDPLSEDQLTDRWKDDVCLQSTPSSCGAASAATIFRALGLNIQEAEIAAECLTSSGGTENWYLARAFRERGFTVNYRIENEFPSDLNVPAIAGVRVGNYGHFIAVIGMSNGEYITGDPLKGRQEIPVDLISNTFYFTGFFMEIH